MCKLDNVPDIFEVAGGDIDIDFRLRNELGGFFSAEGCTIRLAIADWLYRYETLFTYDAEIKEDSNGILSIASVHIPGTDTVNMCGAYVYQISMRDSHGHLEPPVQGKLVISQSADPAFITG